MFGKTYRDDWDNETDQTTATMPRAPRNPKRRTPSKKELLDALEEHNDGYIADETDWLDRGE